MIETRSDRIEKVMSAIPGGAWREESWRERHAELADFQTEQERQTLIDGFVGSLGALAQANCVDGLTAVCEHCAQGNHEILLAVDESCGCRCHKGGKL